MFRRADKFRKIRYLVGGEAVRCFEAGTLNMRTQGCFTCMEEKDRFISITRLPRLPASSIL